MSSAVGWLYILSNVSMPGIVKIGYSMKDPVLRAEELFSTGVPTKFTVEYKILIENPEKLEQVIHGKLEALNHGKEFFKCTVQHAVRVIRSEVAQTALLEVFDKETGGQIKSPIAIWNHLNDYKRFAELEFSPRMALRGLETAYRYIEAIDFDIASRYSSTLSAEMPALYKLFGGGRKESASGKVCTIELINAAAGLLSEYCRTRFKGNTSALRLFSELRLTGKWDLAERLTTALSRTESVESIDAILTSTRLEWSKSLPTSFYCVLNTFMLQGGEFSLCHPNIKMPYPDFDLFDGIDYIRPAGWSRWSIRDDGTPYVGIPRLNSGDLLAKTDLVLLPKGYVTVEEACSYDQTWHSCWADFSAFGGERIAFHYVSHAKSLIYDQVKTDSWPSNDNVDGFLIDGKNEKVGSLHSVLPPIVYLVTDEKELPCNLRHDGIYPWGKSKGFRLGHWGKS